ncbi:hypothetical protein BDR03DRAFT_915547 [Suillus americanus]|nr:hypothetical protein BDR03DRAFT_915547 [Suillus americanus]
MYPSLCTHQNAIQKVQGPSYSKNLRSIGGKPSQSVPSAVCWRCPLKALTIIIHSIVPHAADVERYFSGLGGVQSVEHCNLSVQTFECLSKLGTL